jgi:hypothetical protein
MQIDATTLRNQSMIQNRLVRRENPKLTDKAQIENEQKNANSEDDYNNGCIAFQHGFFTRLPKRAQNCC